MKLLRVGEIGAEKPAILDTKGQPRDLSEVIDDLDGSSLSPDALGRLGEIDPETLPALDGDLRIGPCVARPGKFVGVGLNYHDHAAESGMEAPAEPILFTKATSSICGPCDDVMLPPGSEKTDWEVELGVVIGTVAKHVTEADALTHVAGYCVVNDLSERAFQIERGGQWMKGKSYDRFGPIGPWLVTADEVGDPQDLDLWLKVNGEQFQSGTTSKMIFSVAQVLSHISQFMTLEPGDIITTGTPAGVGMGQRPQKYLAGGDIVELGIGGPGIKGLGAQRQRYLS